MKGRLVVHIGSLVVSLVGLAILVAGFTQLGGGGRSGDLAWYILVCGFLQFVAVRRYLRVERRTRDQQTAVVMQAAAKRTVMKEGPVLGKKCADCARRIVIEDEGFRCKQCNEPLHHACSEHHRSTAHQVSDGSAYR